MTTTSFGREPSSLYGYFTSFFSSAPLPSKTILVLYFALYLFTPLFANPGGSSSELISGLGFGILSTVLLFAALAILIFNRSLFGKQRMIGMAVFLIMVSPLTVLAVSMLISTLAGVSGVPVLRAASSALILIPLIFMVTILFEGVLHYHNRAREPLLLMAFAFISIFLMMYTFATILYMNNLVVDNTGNFVSFYDVFYFSGVTWTTVGYGDYIPEGVGKALAIFESMLGWVLMSLITAIFIRILSSD
ncbi:MAG TPA: potassium channel family protein [Methanomassiliicoccales archaeon]|nr:potassium channel family protein [Methanomassiliicoccales archaeon]